MQGEAASGLDWRDGAAYAPLLGADRSLFAWEWLRRDPRYREVAIGAASARAPAAASGAAGFGLVAFEPPDSSVPDARPLWSAHVDSLVLSAEPFRGASSADMVDLDRLSALATVVADGQGEHLLLSDGLRCIRLDGPRGAFSGGPAGLRYAIAGLAAAEAPLVTLRRFLALCRNGRFARSLHRPEPRARRWILMLRAWDATIAGADQRQIAHELLSRSASEPLWRSREPSIRSQVQRLVRSARGFARDGYLELLRRPPPGLR